MNKDTEKNYKMLRQLDEHKQYKWGVYDCISLLEKLTSIQRGYKSRLRPKWLCDEGSPVAELESRRRAERQFGSVLNAYIETLDDIFGPRADAQNTPSVFVTTRETEWIPIEVRYLDAKPWVAFCGTHTWVKPPVMGFIIKGGVMDSRRELVTILPSGLYGNANNLSPRPFEKIKGKLITWPIS